MLRTFILEEEGQTLLEYGLLISLIAFVVIVAVGFFGRKVNNSYSLANNQMSS
jgi:pilus assembly protein Flp/PilA